MTVNVLMSSHRHQGDDGYVRPKLHVSVLPRWPPGEMSNLRRLRSPARSLRYCSSICPTRSFCERSSLLRSQTHPSQVGIPAFRGMLPVWHARRGRIALRCSLRSINAGARRKRTLLRVQDMSRFAYTFWTVNVHNNIAVVTTIELASGTRPRLATKSTQLSAEPRPMSISTRRLEAATDIVSMH